MPRKTDEHKFDGAVTIAGVPYSARTAKVVKLLTSGEVLVGTEYRTPADGSETPRRSGGVLFPDLNALIALVEQAKARQAFDINGLTFPEPVKAERKPSAQSVQIAALTEQVSQLTALVSNMVTANANGKPAPKATAKS